MSILVTTLDELFKQKAPSWLSEYGGESGWYHAIDCVKDIVGYNKPPVGGWCKCHRHQKCEPHSHEHGDSYERSRCLGHKEYAEDKTPTSCPYIHDNRQAPHWHRWQHGQAQCMFE